MSSIPTRLAAGSLAAAVLLGTGASTAFADEGDGNDGYHHSDNTYGYGNGYNDGYHHDDRDRDRDLHFGPFDIPGSGWIGWQFDRGA